MSKEKNAGAEVLFVAISVFVGGALGTAIRFLIDVFLHDQNIKMSAYVSYSIGLLIVNIVGAFLLGYFGLKWELMPADKRGKTLNREVVRKGITTGMFGALTTYSSLSLFIVHNHYIADIILLITLIIVGIVSAIAGRNLARKVFHISKARYEQLDAQEVIS